MYRYSMWVAKLNVPSKKTLIGSLAAKCQVDVIGYPVSFHKKGNSLFAFVVGEVIGESKNIRVFAAEAKNHKRVSQFEMKKNFMSALLSDPLSLEKFYNPNIIYTQPLFISREGYEIYNIAAWDRNELLKFVRFLEKRNDGKLVKLVKEKIGKIFITSPFPEMTQKQREAIDLAIQKGYYKSPRKIDVKGLAKISGLSFSTYQVHLRKAERKLIPYFLE